MLILYNKDECPFCWRVRMSLARVGVDVDFRAFDAPEWRDVWPKLTAQGTVPVLLDGGLCMTDSQVILEYIEDAFGGTLPQTAQARAEARQMVIIADSAMGAAARDHIFECREHPPGNRDTELLADAALRWQKAVQHWSDRLGDRDWPLGRCCQADYALATRFGLVYAYGMPMQDVPKNVMAWLKRLFQRDEVQRTAPDSVRLWLATGVLD